MQYSYKRYLLTTYRKSVLRALGIALIAFLLTISGWDLLANRIAGFWPNEWLIANILIVPAWPLAIIAALATLLVVASRRLIQMARSRDTAINVELVEVRHDDFAAYRLRLRNWSYGDLERCVVRIEDFVSSNEMILRPSGPLRSTIQPDPDASPVFSLRSGEDRDIPLCSRRHDGSIAIETATPIELACGGALPDITLSPDHRYRLLLGIYGAPHPTILAIELTVDADNQLLVGPI